MGHLYRTLAHILAATAIAVFFSVGVEAHGIVAALATTLGVGALTTFVVSLGLNWARQMLGIFSAGRIIQISLGLLTAWGSLNLAAWLAPQWLTVSHGLITALTMFVAFLVLSVITGNIKAYRGRPWLPKTRFPSQPHR